jgi:hypothetical protein
MCVLNCTNHVPKMQPDIIYANVMLTFAPRNNVWKRNKVLSDRTAKLEPKYASTMYN